MLIADENQTENDPFNCEASLIELFPTKFSAQRHMFFCVLHFHCCRNTRPALCGIWDSEPARMDLDLQLKRHTQENVI